MVREDNPYKASQSPSGNPDPDSNLIVPLVGSVGTFLSFVELLATDYAQFEHVVLAEKLGVDQERLLEILSYAKNAGWVGLSASLFLVIVALALGKPDYKKKE